MKTLWNLTVLTACCLVFLMPGCTQPQPDTRVADEAAIRAADVAFSKAVETRQVEAAMAFYADDPMVLMPNTPMMTAKDTIHKAFSAMLTTPGIVMKWQVTKVEAARSGDFGYTVGAYEMTMTDAKGKPVTDRGKYTTIWKKPADGKWKVVVDMSNSDLPVKPPAK
jgi:ketosteroid isomerase-like protein